jgi:adenylate cyclase
MWAAASAGALVLGLLAVHFWAAPLPGLHRLDRFASDARFRLRGPRPPATAEVVVVGVDDEARRAAPDLGPTRKGWARFLRALADYRPKVIALDLFFSRPERILSPEVATGVRAARAALAAEAATGAGAGSGSAAPPPSPAAAQAAAALDDVVAELAGDAELADAIGKAGTVVLGANFHLGGTAPRLLAEPLGLSRGRHPEVIAGGVRGPRWPQRASGVDFTIEPLARVAAGAGAVNSYRDDDLVLRRVPLAIELPPHFYMPLGMAAVATARGPESMLGAQLVAGADTLKFAGRDVPVGQSASLPLDFPGRGRIPHLSAAAVLDGSAPREALEGKIVFVGLTYAAFDKIATPLDPLDEGVDMHAVLAENLISGRLLRTSGPTLPFVAAVMLVLGSVALQARRVRRRAILPALTMIALMGAWAVLTYHLFVARSLLVSTSPPLVAAATVMLVALIAALATEGREKLAAARGVLALRQRRRWSSASWPSPALAQLGGERRELTVLFSDIRGFSGLSEQMRPEELAAFISRVPHANDRAGAGRRRHARQVHRGRAHGDLGRADRGSGSRTARLRHGAGDAGAAR